MHPEVARELMRQRANEMRVEAHQASLARQLRTALRARRQAKEVFVPPAIPDTVAELLGDPSTTR
jgi:hypothetical protein